MRMLVTVAALVAIGIGSSATGQQSGNASTARSSAAAYNPITILTTMPMASVSEGRLLCATGARGRMVNVLQKAIGNDVPLTVADECLAYLVRVAWLRQFGAPQRIKGNPAPTALALDTAFMTAYSKREAVARGMPTLATLRPVAERCFRATEPDAALCAAIGYAIGTRLASGEALIAR
jgi:hypothetical protein